MRVEIVRALTPYLFAIIVISALSGCAGKSNLTGIMIYGHEVRTVRLCNQTQTYWIQTTPELRELLKSQSHEMSKQPYQELYLEFTGTFTSENEGEFAKDYDGVISLKKINSLSDKIPIKCN